MNDIILVGANGVGKTTLLDLMEYENSIRLTEEELKNGRYPGLSAHTTLIIVDEVSDVELVKRFVSKTTLRHRSPYSHVAKEFKRPQMIFASNSPEFINAEFRHIRKITIS